MLTKIWKGIVWFAVGTKWHALWLLAMAVVLLGTFMTIKASLPVMVNDMSLGMVLGLTAVAVDLVVFSALANGNREIAVPWLLFAVLTLIFSVLGAANILRPLNLGQEQTLNTVAFLVALTFAVGRTISLVTIAKSQDQVKTAPDSASA